MGELSKIQWTDHTFNPWWGCARVSPGCEHCYAETFSKRVGQKIWGVQAERRFFGDKHWAEPVKWNAAAAKAQKRARVFCASMADVFEDRPDLVEWRGRLWRLILETPWLDWQLLTKRPENITRLAPGWFSGAPDNVWIGTTIEDRKRLDRIEHLRRQIASVLFLSLEPLLEDLGEIDLAGIKWVIVGGESGGGARPFDYRWAQAIVEQCRAARVPCFVKQMGSRPQLTSGITGEALPRKLFDRKGGDWDEWPDVLRVRQFPE